MNAAIRGLCWSKRWIWLVLSALHAVEQVSTTTISYAYTQTKVDAVDLDTGSITDEMNTKLNLRILETVQLAPKLHCYLVTAQVPEPNGIKPAQVGCITSPTDANPFHSAQYRVETHQACTGNPSYYLWWPNVTDNVTNGTINVWDQHHWEFKLKRINDDTGVLFWFKDDRADDPTGFVGAPTMGGRRMDESRSGPLNGQAFDELVEEVADTMVKGNQSGRRLQMPGMPGLGTGLGSARRRRISVRYENPLQQRTGNLYALVFRTWISSKVSMLLITKLSAVQRIAESIPRPSYWDFSLDIESVYGSRRPWQSTILCKDATNSGFPSPAPPGSVRRLHEELSQRNSPTTAPSQSQRAVEEESDPAPTDVAPGEMLVEDVTGFEEEETGSASKHTNTAREKKKMFRDSRPTSSGDATTDARRLATTSTWPFPWSIPWPNAVGYPSILTFPCLLAFTNVTPQTGNAPLARNAGSTVVRYGKITIPDTNVAWIGSMFQYGCFFSFANDTHEIFPQSSITWWLNKDPAGLQGLEAANPIAMTILPKTYAEIEPRWMFIAYASLNGTTGMYVVQVRIAGSPAKLEVGKPREYHGGSNLTDYVTIRDIKIIPLESLAWTTASFFFSFMAQSTVYWLQGGLYYYNFRRLVAAGEIDAWLSTSNVQLHDAFLLGSIASHIYFSRRKILSIAALSGTEIAVLYIRIYPGDIGALYVQLITYSPTSPQRLRRNELYRDEFPQLPNQGFRLYYSYGFDNYTFFDIGSVQCQVQGKTNVWSHDFTLHTDTPKFSASVEVMGTDKCTWFLCCPLIQAQAASSPPGFWQPFSNQQWIVNNAGRIDKGVYSHYMRQTNFIEVGYSICSPNIMHNYNGPLAQFQISFAAPIYGTNQVTIDGECERQNSSLTGSITLTCQDSPESAMNQIGTIAAGCRMKVCSLRGDYTGYTPRFTIKNGITQSCETPNAFVSTANCRVTCEATWASELKTTIDIMGQTAAYPYKYHVNVINGAMGLSGPSGTGERTTSCLRDNGYFTFSGCEPVFPMVGTSDLFSLWDTGFLPSHWSNLSSPMYSNDLKAPANLTAVFVNTTAGPRGIVAMSYTRKLFEATRIMSMGPIELRAFNISDAQASNPAADENFTYRSACSTKYSQHSRYVTHHLVNVGKHVLLVCTYQLCQNQWGSAAYVATTTVTSSSMNSTSTTTQAWASGINTTRPRNVQNPHTTAAKTSTSTTRHSLSNMTSFTTSSTTINTSTSTTTTTTTTDDFKCDLDIHLELVGFADAHLGKLEHLASLSIPGVRGRIDDMVPLSLQAVKLSGERVLVQWASINLDQYQFGSGLPNSPVPIIHGSFFTFGIMAAIVKTSNRSMEVGAPFVIKPNQRCRVWRNIPPGPGPPSNPPTTASTFATSSGTSDIVIILDDTARDAVTAFAFNVSSMTAGADTDIVSYEGSKSSEWMISPPHPGWQMPEVEYARAAFLNDTLFIVITSEKYAYRDMTSGQKHEVARLRLFVYSISGSGTPKLTKQNLHYTSLYTLEKVSRQAMFVPHLHLRYLQIGVMSSSSVILSYQGPVNPPTTDYSVTGAVIRVDLTWPPGGNQLNVHVSPESFSPTVLLDVAEYTSMAITGGQTRPVPQLAFVGNQGVVAHWGKFASNAIATAAAGQTAPSPEYLYVVARPIKTCFWTHKCALVKPMTLRHSVDLAYELSGRGWFNITWVPPASIVTKYPPTTGSLTGNLANQATAVHETFGYRICTGNLAWNSDRGNCAGYGDCKNSNGARWLHEIGQASPQAIHSWLSPGVVDTYQHIFVCVLNAARSAGEAAVVEFVDAGDKRCTLGMPCNIRVPGASNTSELYFVHFPNSWITYSYSDAWLSQLTKQELVSHCTNAPQKSWTTTYLFKARDCNIPGVSGCSFGNSFVGRIEHGIFGLCVNSSSALIEQGVVIVGLFRMYGPSHKQIYLAERGQPLWLDLQNYGMWHAATMKPSRVMAAQGRCPEPGVVPVPVFGFPTELPEVGLFKIHGVSTEVILWGSYVYQYPIAGVQPGSFVLCWCQESSQKSANCTREVGFQVNAGMLDMVGPFTPDQMLICWRGIGCHQRAYGMGFNISDSVFVCSAVGMFWTLYWTRTNPQENVGAPHNVINRGVTTKANSRYSAIEVAIRSPIIAQPNRYSLCWTSGFLHWLRGYTTRSDGATLTRFALIGPDLRDSTNDVLVCTLGIPCVLQIPVFNWAQNISNPQLADALAGRNPTGSSGGFVVNSASRVLLKGPINNLSAQNQIGTWGTNPDWNYHPCEQFPSVSLFNNSTPTTGQCADTTTPSSGATIEAFYLMDQANIIPFSASNGTAVYALCWCMGISDPTGGADGSCNKTQDFRAWIGTLVVHGPDRPQDQEFKSSFICAQGTKCVVRISGFGIRSMQSTYQVRIRVMYQCGVGSVQFLQGWTSMIAPTQTHTGGVIGFYGAASCGVACMHRDQAGVALYYQYYQMCPSVYKFLWNGYYLDYAGLNLPFCITGDTDTSVPLTGFVSSRRRRSTYNLPSGTSFVGPSIVDSSWMEFTWNGNGGAVGAQPGTYQLCWCYIVPTAIASQWPSSWRINQTIKKECANSQDFSLHVGDLLVPVPPAITNHVCTAGVGCVISINGDFSGTQIRIKVPAQGGITSGQNCAGGGGKSHVLSGNPQNFPLAYSTGYVIAWGDTTTNQNNQVVTSFSFSGAVRSPGQDELWVCWCGEILTPGTACSDHRTFIGELILSGPGPDVKNNYFVCVQGHWCSIPPLHGDIITSDQIKLHHPQYTSPAIAPAQAFWMVHPLDGDLLYVATSGSCGTTNPSSTWGMPSSLPQVHGASTASYGSTLGLYNSSCGGACNTTGGRRRVTSSTGYSRFDWYVSDSSHRAIMGFGIVNESLRPGDYDLCWCRPLPANNHCRTYQDFITMPMGAMRIVGPTSGQSMMCIMGRNCDGVLTGAGLREDYVIVIPFLALCGSATTHVGTAYGNEGFLPCKTDAYGCQTLSLSFPHSSSRIKNPFTNYVGLYKLCWCQNIYIGEQCTPNINTASIFVKGPFSVDHAVKMGDDLTIQNVNGIGLDNVDQVMLLLQCGQPNVYADNTVLPYVNATKNATSSTYELGNLTSSRVKALPYYKCWCQPTIDSSNNVLACDRPERFNTPFGRVEVYCTEGHEDLAYQTPGAFPTMTGTCVGCPRGWYLPFAGVSMFCSTCGLQATTQYTGTVSLSSCVCEPGFYMDTTNICEACRTYDLQYPGPSPRYCLGYENISGVWQRSIPKFCPGNTSMNDPTPPNITECQCHPGYTPDPPNPTGGTTFACQPCPRGRFKSGHGMNLCIDCETFVLNSTTEKIASDDQNDCKCDAGFYLLSPSGAGTGKAQCVTCNTGYYCTGVLTPDPLTQDPSFLQSICPAGATTTGPQASTVSMCLCAKGYAWNSGTSACELCPAGYYKDVIAKALCTGKCPVNTTSAAGAANISNCVCDAARGYADPNPNDGVLQCLHIQASSATTGSTSFQAPAVQGQVFLINMKDQSTTIRGSAAVLFAQRVASLMGITGTIACATPVHSAANTISVPCGDVDVILDYTHAANSSSTANTSIRRLSHDANEKTISVASFPELQSLTQSMLLKRAARIGATDDEVDAALDADDPKGAFIALILDLQRSKKEVKLLSHWRHRQRRLQTSQLSTAPGVTASWVVRKPSSQEAAVAASQFSENNLLAALHYGNQEFLTAGGITSIGTGPTVSQVTTWCPAFKAKPAGASFVSIDTTCKCKEGYFKSSQTGQCVTCPFHYYKHFASDTLCLSCNPTGTEHTFTHTRGATAWTDCYCNAGYYRASSSSNCTPCLLGYFCPRDYSNSLFTCVVGSETLSTQSTTALDCKCLAGYGREIAGQPCVRCVQGKYKPLHKDEPCIECPQPVEMTSAMGSTQIQQCACNPRFYFEPSPGVYGNCLTCTDDDGLVCDGGFENNSLTHVMPIAEPGYFLTGKARSKVCLKDPNGRSFCKGGRDSAVPCFQNCACLEGHDGFLCQNCKPGWTRDSYIDRCKKCGSPELLYFGCFLIWLNAIWSGLLSHVLTIMAIRAGQGTKSLHSVLIRLFQSWLLSMTVLRVFDFAKIDMFSWGVQSVQMKSQTTTSAGCVTGSNSTNSSGSQCQPPSGPSLLIPFPSWFKEVSRVFFSFDFFSTDIGTPAPTIECLVEHIMGEDNAGDWKYIAPAIYHVSYPLFVLFWMLVMDLILVYALYPVLERRGMMGRPHDAKKLKTWLLDRIKPALKDACGEAEVPEEYIEETVICFRDVISQFTISEHNMKLLAKFPRDGILGLADFIEGPENMIKAKECILWFSFRGFKQELEFAFAHQRSELGLPEAFPKILENASNCSELRSSMVSCSHNMGIEYFASLLRTRGSLLSGIHKESGYDVFRFRVSLMCPMFEQKAAFHGFSKELTSQIWISLRDHMIEVAGEHHNTWTNNGEEQEISKFDEMVETLSDRHRTLRTFADWMSDQAPGSATLLLMAMFKEAIMTYLTERATTSHLAEGADSLWDLIVECCKTPDVSPVELKERMNRSPEQTLVYIAEHAGTGYGGCLLVCLHRAQIIDHFTMLQHDITKDELADSWSKVCALAFATDFYELERLLSEDPPSTLVEKCTRTAAANESATSGGFFGGLGVAAGAAVGTAAAGGAVAQEVGVVDGHFGAGGEGAVMMLGAFEAVKAMTHESALTKDYPVLGLFRAPKGLRLRGFLADARPLIYICLYTMWYPTTKRLLLLVHCESEIEVKNDVASQFQRWMKQSNYVCLEGAHFLITILAFGGVGVWSIGLLVLLAYEISSHARELTKQDVQRRLSYFITGYQLDKAYWDILVKKSDNLITIVITYTSVAVDLKAKILCYTVSAACYLLIHVYASPFDDRKNRLCDHIEFLGLGVRCSVFLLLQMLLIFQPEVWVATIVALFTFAGAAFFIVSICIHISCEFFADLTKDPGEGVKIDQAVVFAPLRQKLGQDREDNRGDSFLDKCVGCGITCGRCCYLCGISPIWKTFIKYAKWSSSVWQRLEDDALCMMPAGKTTRRVQGRTGRTKGKGAIAYIRHAIAERFFFQRDQWQREYIVSTISSFYSHLLCQLETERLEIGDGLLGRFLVISAALKQAQLNQEIPMGCVASDKAEIVKRNIKDAVADASKYAMLDDDNDQGIDMLALQSESNEGLKKHVEKLRLTGEDLNAALMLIQRLDEAVVHELLAEAKQKLVNHGTATTDLYQSRIHKLGSRVSSAPTEGRVSHLSNHSHTRSRAAAHNLRETTMSTLSTARTRVSHITFAHHRTHVSPTDVANANARLANDSRSDSVSPSEKHAWKTKGFELLGSSFHTGEKAARSSEHGIATSTGSCERVVNPASPEGLKYSALAAAGSGNITGNRKSLVSAEPSQGSTETQMRSACSHVSNQSSALAAASNDLHQMGDQSKPRYDEDHLDLVQPGFTSRAELLGRPSDMIANGMDAAQFAVQEDMNVVNAAEAEIRAPLAPSRPRTPSGQTMPVTPTEEQETNKQPRV